MDQRVPRHSAPANSALASFPRIAHATPGPHSLESTLALLAGVLQLRAAVILQKSLREGFGLTVTEARERYPLSRLPEAWIDTIGGIEGTRH